MRSIKLEQTGHKLTKVYIGFYDFQRLQGKYLGYIAKLIGYRGVTHTGLILETDKREFHLVLCSGQKEKDGSICSTCKTYDLQGIQKIGGILLDRIEMPLSKDMTLYDTIMDASFYTDTNAWDLIFHIFIGRFIGLTRPRNCTTHVCRFFKLPDCFLPAHLYRKYYDNHLTVRSSASWKNNRC